MILKNKLTKETLESLFFESKKIRKIDFKKTLNFS